MADELNHPFNPPALIEAFYPGSEGGGAIAEAIFGLTNSWGKMPYTIYPADWVRALTYPNHAPSAPMGWIRSHRGWIRSHRGRLVLLLCRGIHPGSTPWGIARSPDPKAWCERPCQVRHNSMLDHDVQHGEGRTYRYFKGRATIPFGFGLSYTSFALSLGELPPASWSIDTASLHPLNLSVILTNTGARAGDDVVQAYFAPLALVPPGVPNHPIKALWVRREGSNLTDRIPPCGSHGSDPTTPVGSGLRARRRSEQRCGSHGELSPGGARSAAQRPQR